MKRDAPAAGGNNYMETLQKQMEEFAKTVNNQMSQAFDPDTIKKNFNELVDNATKTVSDRLIFNLKTSVLWFIFEGMIIE